VAVHTWFDMVVDATMGPLIDWDVMEADEREVLAERLAGWAEKYPDVTVRRLVAGDRPARALVEESGRAQLVVVGSRGRGGISGLLLGSVSQARLHHAACPVAVVQRAPADAGEQGGQVRRTTGGVGGDRHTGESRPASARLAGPGHGGVCHRLR
jgi:hypothetical protein